MTSRLYVTGLCGVMVSALVHLSTFSDLLHAVIIASRTNLSLSQYLYRCPCLSQSLSLSLSVSLHPPSSPSLCLLSSVCLPLFLCLSVCLSLSLSEPTSLSVSLARTYPKYCFGSLSFEAYL